MSGIAQNRYVGRWHERRADLNGVSRRRFVRAAGAAGVVGGLAGCADFVGGGDGGSGDGSDGGSTGDGSSSETTTVQWGFDPVAASTTATQSAGTPRERTVGRHPCRVSAARPDSGKRRATYNRLLSSQETTPDMFMMDNGWVNIFIQRGQLANLSEVLPESALSTIENEYSAFTDTARPRQREPVRCAGVPGLPDDAVPQGPRRGGRLRSDRNNWATEPMTWEEWSNIAADTYDDADVDFGFTTQWDVYEGTSCCTSTSS